MKVYFVRHGETVCDQQRVHKSDECGLSPEGFTQAQALARRFKETKIDQIICSDMLRALQTTAALEKRLHQTAMINPLVRERKIPSELVGKSMHDSKLKKRHIHNHHTDALWHHSDEENFFDFQKRVHAFLDELIHRPDATVLVVSHGNFIKMVMCSMIFRKKLSPEIFYAFSHHVKVSYTGITICETQDDGSWALRRINDCTHLN